MRLMLPSKNIWEENASLICAFGLDKIDAPIVSVVGAGGKTKTIEQLAMEYQNLRKQVIVTTTTHMFKPSNFSWCSQEATDILKAYLKKDYAVWVGLPCGDEKMTAPTPYFLETLKSYQIPILIEADGAKRLPFKVPRDHEPVIMPGSHAVIGVLGMDALGKPIKEICFHPEMVANYLHKTEDQHITIEDYVEVIKGSNGLAKGVTCDMEYIVVLNKVDTEAKLRDAYYIREILRSQGIRKVYLTNAMHSERGCKNVFSEHGGVV